MKFIINLLILILCLTLFSCAARIDGALAADGSAQLSVRMSLEAGVTALIQRLSSAAGQQGQPVLDGPALARSLTSAPGISSVSFRNTSVSAIEGQVRISRISDFLASADTERDARRRFITFEQGRSGGRCAVTINRENGHVMLDFFSSEIADYLNALMAPIATGDEMTKPEYLELVASFYNRNIANEIASTRIRVAIDFPGTITNVRGGTFSGRRASFDIPVLDLLVLETPLVYEVTWN